VRWWTAAALAVALAGGFAGSVTGAPSSRKATEQVLVGRSVHERAITAVQVGDPNGTRIALVVGVTHGDEPAGLRIARAIKRLSASDPVQLTGTQLWVIATVNPDGVRAHTRKNAHGVDLNRNFPYRWRDRVPKSSGYYPGPRPASEPETRGVMRFVRRVRPDLSVWYHQPWAAVLACRGRPQIALEYAKLAGMPMSCRGEGLRGTAISWETHVVPDSSAFVVEMPPGKPGAGTVERQAEAALTVAEGR
jgi:protein MpaA